MDGLRTYTYNDEGIRISKVVDGVEHKYQLNGTQIVSETWGNHMIFYIYDENGSIARMRYRTSDYAEGIFDEYLFEKNLQGDVVAIYNASGTKLVSYTYDAWGKVTTTYSSGGASTGAQYNPFRYRGYYYDTETGFYYLNSRYYDPSVGRFINLDALLGSGGMTGYNLFAYCENSPIVRTDHSGQMWQFVPGLHPMSRLYGSSMSMSHCTITSRMYSHDSSAYDTYVIRSMTAYHDAQLGGYYSGSLSSSFWNLGAYYVPGAISVTDDMAVYTGSSGKTQVGGVISNTAGCPHIMYPGNDPTKCVVPGFEWRGSGPPVSGFGNYVNIQTGEWLHPDLNHGPPIGPHWDYGVRGSSQGFRIFPDGTISPK